MALSLPLIVETALRLQNQEGFGRLTTRRVAAELGVQGPALYRYVRSKQELLGHMTSALMMQVAGDIVPAASWQDYARQIAHGYRRAMLGCRDAMMMMAAGLPAETTRTELVPGLYRPFISFGFEFQDAFNAARLIFAFVGGYVLMEQNEAIGHMLEEDGRMKADQAFAVEIETIILGLEARRKLAAQS